MKLNKSLKLIFLLGALVLIFSAQVAMASGPGIEVVKVALGGPTYISGSDIDFEITVTNTGTVDLFDVQVDDIKFDLDNNAIGTIPQCSQFLGDLAAGASVSYSCTDFNVTESYVNAAFVLGYYEGGMIVKDGGQAPVTIIPPPSGGEGCTPGYWKQRHHLDSWTGYDPGDSFATVFGVSYDKSLLNALKTGGGHEKALGRHATAALLNAASPDVSYDFTTAEIISLVQGAFSTGDFEGAKDMLESANESGCPLD